LKVVLAIIASLFEDIAEGAHHYFRRLLLIVTAEIAKIEEGHINKIL